MLAHCSVFVCWMEGGLESLNQYPESIAITKIGCCYYVVRGVRDVIISIGCCAPPPWVPPPFFVPTQITSVS